MDDWKQLFKKKILDRGFDYYEDGAVLRLEKTDYGYSAIVMGTDDYRVKIHIKDSKITDVDCSCPYAEGGDYCKHMAAVLYEMDDAVLGETVSQSRSKSQPVGKTELEKLIEELSEEDLRKYVYEYAVKDDDFKSSLLIRYTQTIDATHMLQMKRRISEIAYQYGDRNEFISYRNAGEFTSAIECFMEDNVQELINGNYNMEAFEIVNQVFYLIGTIAIDDSDGGTSILANQCYDYWREILKQCNNEEKDQMFQWFEQHQGCDYVLDYLEDYLDDFMMNEFHDQKLLLRKLNMVDERIKAVGNPAESDLNWSSEYEYTADIIRRLELMRDLDYSEEDIIKYRNQYRKYSAIRNLEIEEFVESEKYEDAICVLLESKEKDQKYQGLISDYSCQLIDIYERTQRKKEYREELIYQVFSCSQTNLQYIHRLKKICTDEEWYEYRKQLVNEILDIRLSCMLLESEGLYEELLERISKKSNVHYLDQYEKVLKNYFPEKVRDLYVSFVEMEASHVAKRKQYCTVMQYLKKIKTYPEGAQLAEKIAETWKIVYARRRAMMDELRMAGF